VTSRRGRALRLAAATAVIVALYLPTLGAPFDFADDGNLVYPAPPMPLADRFHLYWQKVAANYEDLGPFRPVLWAHWEIQADALAASPVAWRLVRLVWLALSTLASLLLLEELRIRPAAAFFTAALAAWNPYRSEIWTSLTLSEGVALPYALGALLAALRAGRSARPFAWELAAIAGTSLALGCKNTFAALVPAEWILRLDPDASGRRPGSAVRAALLAVPLLFAAAHLAVFLRGWHPGQYAIRLPGVAELAAFAKALRGAASLDFVGAGLVLAVVAVARNGRLARVLRDHRGASLAGAALLAAGTGVYLPLGTVAGRYTIPAVWGVDLWIAALVSTLVTIEANRAKRLAIAALGIGLVLVAAANLGRQEKLASRHRMLWEALHAIERSAPKDATIAWVAGVVGAEEGVHFGWHLRGRGRGDLSIAVYDAAGNLLPRRELGDARGAPILAITGRTSPPLAGRWRKAQDFSTGYRLGFRSHACSLWERTP
jgi:hypothetical protein